MTPQKKDTLRLVGEIVALMVAVSVLTAAIKTGGEFWLVPWRAFNDYQHVQEMRYQRDSLVMHKVERWVDYSVCKEKNGRDACLDPDRP